MVGKPKKKIIINSQAPRDTQAMRTHVKCAIEEEAVGGMYSGSPL
jgi:hypothetical protein